MERMRKRERERMKGYTHTDKNFESKAAGFLSRMILAASLRPLSLESVLGLGLGLVLGFEVRVMGRNPAASIRPLSLESVLGLGLRLEFVVGLCYD
jgi:hypothetical protein